MSSRLDKLVWREEEVGQVVFFSSQEIARKVRRTKRHLLDIDEHGRMTNSRLIFFTPKEEK